MKIEKNSVGKKLLKLLKVMPSVVAGMFGVLTFLYFLIWFLFYFPGFELPHEETIQKAFDERRLKKDGVIDMRALAKEAGIEVKIFCYFSDFLRIGDLERATYLTNENLEEIVGYRKVLRAVPWSDQEGYETLLFVDTENEVFPTRFGVGLNLSYMNTCADADRYIVINGKIKERKEIQKDVIKAD